MLLHFLDSLFHQLSWSGNSNFLISQKVTSYYLELSFNIYNLFGVNCFFTEASAFIHEGVQVVFIYTMICRFSV